MEIGISTACCSRTDYRGYKARGNAQIDSFYKGLSHAVQKAETQFGNRPEEAPVNELRKYMGELYEKIKSGDIRQTFQIGAQALTLEEWDKLIRNADLSDRQERAKEEV